MISVYSKARVKTVYSVLEILLWEAISESLPRYTCLLALLVFECRGISHQQDMYPQRHWLSLFMIIILPFGLFQVLLMNYYYYCIEYNCIIETRLFFVSSSIIANSEPRVLENYKIYAIPLIGCKSGQLIFNSSELYLLMFLQKYRSLHCFWSFFF